MARKGKITSSFSVSRLADEKIEHMVDSGTFSNRSNAVETSVLLMGFVLQAGLILPAAEEMGIKPLQEGGIV